MQVRAVCKDWFLRVREKDDALEAVLEPMEPPKEGRREKIKDRISTLRTDKRVTSSQASSLRGD